MSFGVGQSAIASVKSNRNLLSKRDRLKHRLYFNKTKKLEFSSEEITAFELRRITKKIKRDNRNFLINRLIVVTLIMSVFWVLVFYFFK